MKSLRFSMLALLALLSVTGVGCLAMVNATELWGTALYSLAFLLAVVAVLACINRRGPDRAFWLGVAVGTIAYLGWQSMRPQPLVTDKLLDSAYPLVQRDVADSTTAGDFGPDPDGEYGMGTPGAPPGMPAFGGMEDMSGMPGTIGPPGMDMGMFGGGPPVATRFPEERHFRTVGHALLAIVFGLFCGLVSRTMHRDSPPRSAESS